MYQIIGNKLVFDNDFNEPLTSVIFPKHVTKVVFGTGFH